MEEARDVLHSQGGGADSIAVRPTVRVESTQKIGQGIGISAMDEFAGRTSGVKSFGVDGNAIEKCLRICEKQDDYSKRDAQEGALQSANYPQCFALPPRRTPQESDGPENRASQGPHKHPARGAHEHARGTNSQRHEAKSPSLPPTKQKVSAESDYLKQNIDEHFCESSNDAI